MNPLLLHKPIGMTPLELIENYRKSHPDYTDTKMTYAGRLDPMAEGLVLVLAGEDVYEKNSLLDLDKTYEATILLGIQTDTLDLLGIPDTNTQETTCENEQIKKVCNALIGTHEWPYPAYSSKPVKGKPLFQRARENALDQITIPKRAMTIKELEIKTITTITHTDLLHQAQTTIPLVKGDFRQKEILEAWENTLRTPQTFQTITLTTTVTSGTYIRTLANQIGTKLGHPSMLIKLNRTKIGTYPK